MALRVGHNINISKGLVSSADYAESLGCNFYQIFLVNPHTFKPKKQSLDKLLRLRKKLEEKDITIVVHGSLILNFCNPPDTFVHYAGLKLLVNDLKDSVKIGAIGVIVHMGKQLKLEKEDAINNYVSAIKKALKYSPKESTIIFETGAGQGTEVCTSIIQLGLLYKKFTTQERSRIKFCIDTCHVFSAGYDLGCPKYVEQVFSNLIKRHLGWKNIACIHLNDSKRGLNSRVDRHADITKGNIESDGLKTFIKICHKKKIPIVLETPCDCITNREQISLVKVWCLVDS